jgi:hypothetical protein
VAQQSIAMAHRLADPRTLATVLIFSLHVFHGQPGDITKCLAYATEIVRLAEETDEREMAVDGRGWLTAALLRLGDIQELDVQLAVRSRLAQELQYPHHLYMSAVQQAMRALLDGRFAEGEQLAQQALAVGQRLQ